ncbi:Oxidase ustYa [Colletotrichum trifolii]|uniref:Oxidase ustYa n=1 Tax=Colletotrichum trifolii TaxID=5466 RepID=A0A4V3HX77_COLTR|nr:Oxidase ustYa [Colletotrichum trifolii]
MSLSGQRYEKISDDGVPPREEEQDGLLDSHGPRYRRLVRLSTTSPLTTVCLSISNAVTVAIVLVLLLSRGSLDSPCPTPTTVVYPPRPAWFPPEIPVTKVLHGDKRYGQAPNPESIEAWNQLLPKGRGWVRVNNQSALPDLPGLNHSLPEHRAFPTVFHQLHCLYSTMDSYYELLNVTYGRREKRELGPGDPGWNSEHLNHCWDYLRQTIMCNADVTLEWKKYDERVGTGWGYRHQCKDWDAIIAWAEDHRTSNNWGILRGGGERIPLE